MHRNRFNPRKLLHSKWTAVQPQNREKHFLATRVLEDDAGLPQRCVLEAVHSRREVEMDWHELQDAERWRQGWL